MEENKKRLFVIIVIGALVIGNAFFGLNYFLLRNEIKEQNYVKGKMELNDKIINFTSLFIKKVLQADQEINFETRLSLENAVRDLNDKEVMAHWQNFTESKTENEAQDNVKKLLEILINKIEK
jgi:hypothetical protein